MDLGRVPVGLVREVLEVSNEIRFPKPARRSKKPRKPIKSRNRKGNHTSRHRAKRMSLAKQAAALWSFWVKRDGRCQFVGELIGDRFHTQCGGGLQAMHGFGKKAYPGVRYAVWNGFCGCAAAHTYYTWRTPEWENYLRRQWGEDLYQQRLREAMMTRKYDLRVVIETFRAALGTRD